MHRVHSAKTPSRERGCPLRPTMKTRHSSNAPRGISLLDAACAATTASASFPVATQTTPLPLRVRLATVAGVLGATFVAVLGIAASAHAQTPTITVTSTLPSDITGGASAATLTQAAEFAWQEFIALNWPAVPQSGQPGNRETADATKFFGDPSYNSSASPLVWHTYRGKVELFPGTGAPAGSTPSSPVTALPSATPNPLENLNTGSGPAYYGYDALPLYTYGTTAIPPAPGTTPISPTPWINLDENSQIGLDLIYAGVGAGNPGPSGNQILFMAKAGRPEFDYAAQTGWWNGSAPTAATTTYVATNRANPPAGSTTYVSLPNGTIELKAAWRKLAPHEDASRYYTTAVRYYVPTSATNSAPQFVDDTFALLALHIIQKTPSAPYFIYATFEQADNITDVYGSPAEDVDGVILRNASASAFTPDIVSQNATAQSYQTFSPSQSSVQTPFQQLFYQNIPNLGLVNGTVLVNRRKHAIPEEIVAVNRAAHRAITTYVRQNLPVGTKTPWAHYKLVNVQAKPIDKPVPGKDYTGSDIATYYQANSVVETDQNLQVFSGRFYPISGVFSGNKAAAAPSGLNVSNTITDFNPDGSPAMNVQHGGRGFNMGGCMGCHGNAQRTGSDFSFIFGSPVVGGPGVPATVQPATNINVNQAATNAFSIGQRAPSATTKKIVAPYPR